jgi:hypothetical protein
LATKLNSRVWVSGAIGAVTRVSGAKIGRGIVLMLRREPGTMKVWTRGEKANSRVLVVIKGRALGTLPNMLQ